MEYEKKVEITEEDLECVSGGTARMIPEVGSYVNVKYFSNNTVRFGKVLGVDTKYYGNGSEGRTVCYVKFYDGRQPEVDTVFPYQTWG